MLEEHFRVPARVFNLCSDDPEKRGPLAARYGVAHTYDYDQYEDCLRSGEIDAVYLAVPNHPHR